VTNINPQRRHSQQKNETRKHSLVLDCKKPKMTREEEIEKKRFFVLLFFAAISEK
jgi:hypothetical protein